MTEDELIAYSRKLRKWFIAEGIDLPDAMSVAGQFLVSAIVEGCDRPTQRDEVVSWFTRCLGKSMEMISQRENLQ